MAKRLENIECETFSNFLIDNHIPFMRIETNIPAKKDGFGKIMQLKKEGWKSGYPDYFITMPIMDKLGNITYSGLFIEMKKPKGSFPVQTGTDAQYGQLMILAQCGYASFCCKGAEIAQEVVINYLNGLVQSLTYVAPNKRILEKARCYNEQVR